MASGIVWINLHSDDHRILYCITPWFAVAVWLVLAVLLGMRLVHQRDRFEHEARSPAALNGRCRHRSTRHPVGDRGLRHGRRGGSSHRLECFGR